MSPGPLPRLPTESQWFSIIIIAELTSGTDVAEISTQMSVLMGFETSNSLLVVQHSNYYTIEQLTKVQLS